MSNSHTAAAADEWDAVRVIADVANVWQSPAAIKANDAPAVADDPDLAAWIEALPVDERVGREHPRVVTQARAGEAALVLEASDGWSKALFTEQGSSVRAQGYEGWIRTAHLTADQADAPVGARQIVSCLSTPARVLENTETQREPAAGCAQGSKSRILTFGTYVRLRSDGSKMLESGENIAVAGSALAEPVWDVSEILRTAESFLGVPYVWGGASGLGTDCSGLAWQCLRRCGRTAARDASDQAMQGACVDRSEIAPGDLIFFGRGQVVHVGIALNSREMIHASRAAGCVEQARIDGVYPGDLAGIRRWTDATGSSAALVGPSGTAGRGNLKSAID